MKPIKKILVPTDFSRGSEYARAFAHRLAVRFGATVDLIHVIPSTYDLMMPISKEMLAELNEKLKKEAEHKLEMAMMNYEEENQGKIWIAEERKPSEAIIKQITRDPNRYDLVVMGAKGADRTRMRRGGTTIRTIRSSPVPVLSVDNDLLKKGLRNIVVPVDTSVLSFSAIPMAMSVAKAFGSEITLLYVMEIYAGVMGGSGLTPADIQREKIYEKMTEKLSFWMKTRYGDELTLKREAKPFKDTLILKENGEELRFRLRVEVKVGQSAHQEIEAYMEDHGDMIVMTTHGHTGIAHLFLGSVAEKVVQYVKKPVLTVKPQPAEFDEARKNDSGVVGRYAYL